MATRRRRPGRRRKLELRRTLFLLPNLITLSSVFCGFYSMVLSSRATSDDDYRRASLLIVFAMFFDILDGRVARMTKTESAFGLQIDSLADLVSFGAAPALLMHHWVLGGLGTLGTVACFAFVAAGAIRLARFNVLSTDPAGAPTKPGKYIVGLPIPGAAGVVVALVLGDARLPALALGVTISMAALMVSSVRFRSFKDLRPDARTFAFIGFALGTSAVIFFRLQPGFVLVWLLGIYVALGIVESLWQISKRVTGRDGGSLPPLAEARNSHHPRPQPEADGE